MNKLITSISASANVRSIIWIMLFICSLSGVNLLSQVTQQWVSRYNGPASNIDMANAMVVDASGNVYVTGASTGSGSNYDYATVKYNSAGVQQWFARYNGSGNNEDIAYSIAVDATGNVYVTGYSKSGSTAGTEDYVTIKYNSAGVSQWTQIYNGTGNNTDIAYSIAIDGTGNVYVTGASTGSGTNHDYATIKYNVSGAQQWVQRYNGPGNNIDEAKSLRVSSSGDVFVTGYSRGGAAFGTEDYATIKYNTSGAVQWTQRYNGTGNGYDVANSLAIDAAGNVYVTGACTGSGTNYDYVSVKYNTSGVQQWLQTYNGPGNNWDEATSIAVDGTGNVYVTGYSTGSGTGFDYATMKYNSAGTQQWLQRFNGPASSIDQAISIAVDASGNVYSAGWSQGSTSNFDYSVIKYNSAGTQQWEKRYNGPANTGDFGTSFAIDGTGNLYISGYSDGIGTSSDYATIKYSQTVGVEPLNSEIPSEYSLSQNYPNPFNPATNVEFKIADFGFASLQIYNQAGQLISTLVNEDLQPGTYIVRWNAANQPSGVYFYKLVTEGFAETKKMILIK